jgi:bifunctional non-homologous end joining protein LigD
MGLGEYHRKRDFKVTPEPRGDAPRAKSGRSYCIQKHAATRLHYDFRLELEGVLKSWAVPKGPSLDPADKRLAMATEDHPVEYGSFEGTIPEGEYGGGAVVLWDRGTWEPVEDPHKGFHKGSLKFVLHGEKLQGRWALVKIKGRDARDSEKTWLLIKEKDEFVRPSSGYSIVDARPESVATGRTLEEIAANPERVWHSNRPAAAPTRLTRRAQALGLRPPSPPARKVAARKVAKGGKAPRKRARKAAAVDGLPAVAAAVPGARKAEFPTRFAAQLATAVTAAPTGDDWLHEMKFDGYRILAFVKDGGVRLVSRNGKDWTNELPSVVKALEGLRVRQALIDGEVAAVLPDGTTSFQAMQNAWNSASQPGIVYFVFDVPYLEGYDLTRARLEDRKKAAQSVVETVDTERLRYSDHVVGSGPEVFAQACKLPVEGILSKRRDAPYEPGRSRSWLKIKCLRRQEFAIGGFTEPEGSRVGIGALLLGVYDAKGRFHFAGKVGTGFTTKTLEDLERRLKPLERKQSPFEKTTIAGVRKAHWVEPKLVAEVSFFEWTTDGRLRHPSFQGLRHDKKATEVVREEPAPTEEVVEKESAEQPAPAAPSRPLRKPPVPEPRGPSSRRGAAPVEAAGVRLTNPDRILFPGQGVSKRDLAQFYEAIADWILPHVKGRPLTLVRCPEGTSKPCFYMKHTGVWAPPALRRVKIQEKTKVGEYLVVDDLAGLVSLVQMGILEVHTWNSVADRLETCDRVVFDLDPDPAVPWERVVEAAVLLRTRLSTMDLESFVKTTGGKGLHVVVPLKPGASWDDAFAFSMALAEGIERKAPGAFTTVMPKARRKGRILIDTLRNRRGNTSVSAYSTRAKPHAPVSTPLTWDELGPEVTSDHFTIANIRERLDSLEADPWAGYFKARQRITAAMKRELGA